MSHNRLCARSSTRRCRCSCAGLLHGYLPAQAPATPPRYTQLTLVAVGESGRRRRFGASIGAGPGVGTSSYLHGWVRTHRRLVTTITEVVTEGVWQAIADRPEAGRGHLGASDHTLCALLVAVARRLDGDARASTVDGSSTGHASVGLTTWPVHDGMVGDDRAVATRAYTPDDAPTGPAAAAAVNGSHGSHGRMLGAVAGVTIGPVVHRVLQLIGAGPLDEVATLVRIAALATCPDARWHPEVQQLTSDDAAMRGLGRLTGHASVIDPVPA